ncbi:MAG TPA: hypothetical protein VLA59_09315 [Patescibacteria group bacterium]|nr:hypothetical protein [Patescibacteria group bacterium]
MRFTTSRRLLAAAAITSLVVVGCATDDASPGADGEATVVAVSLQEWAVVPDQSSAPAGDITFAVTNDGPDDIHEFVVLRTDLDPADLPVDENGVVSEEGEGIEVIDEIEDIPVGDSQDLTVSLDAGNYVLICNIWSPDEGEAHYKLGMRVAFTVDE